MQQTGKPITIRRGQADEAAALARLHVDVWRATYRDYAPKEALDLLDETKRLPYWETALATTGHGTGVWVLEEARSILGVVSVGTPGHPAFEGRAEIKHLYISLPAQGRGLGERLLKTALAACQKTDVQGVGLAVVRQNERAQRFYRKMGGVEVGHFIDPGPLWRSHNVLMAWDFA